jgi:hypothetical protein
MPRIFRWAPGFNSGRPTGYDRVSALAPEPPASLSWEWTMGAFRRHLRLWAAAWIVFQATSISAFVPLDTCAAHLAARADEQRSCHKKATPAPCPMRAADGVPCPMHRGTVHDRDQTSRDVCSMRGTCDPPVAALFALLSNHGVLTPSSEALPDLSQSPASMDADEHPTSRLAPPDSPPPRA